MALTKANQEWSLDFVHDALDNGRRVRMLTVVDDFTRESIKITVDTSLSGRRVCEELEQVIECRGKPGRIPTQKIEVARIGRYERIDAECQFNLDSLRFSSSDIL